jgi:hypothetical protein
MASADIINPQTFNRYVYVGNNPVNITDPTGLGWGVLDNKLKWFDGDPTGGYTPYDSLVGVMEGTNQLVVLSATSSMTTPVANPAEALRLIGRAVGVGAAAFGASALGLGIPVAIAAAYIAAVVYSPGQVDATMDDCMACGRYIQNHVNMVNSKADELEQQINQSSSWKGETSPADPNSVKPDPDDNKPRYEQSPKHGKNQRGNVAPAPTNGQSTLDSSVQVRSTSPRRVGVDPSTGEFVVFDQTVRGVFHGHVRNWDGLTRQMRNALVKSGQVNRRGKTK